MWKKNDIYFTMVAFGSPSTSSMKGTPMGNKKVLIIDDEKLILTTTTLLLKHANMDVVTAKSGMEGIAVAEKEKPDIILLDIMMPGMDGWSVLARIKADDRLCGIPVVLFSGDEQVDSGRKARECGASAVCEKPFDAYDLIDTINGLIEKERP
jgi:CheY-like chemotaxis protein